ncbi:hypothetical protein B296_00054176 [Ensete ventricosum]|uniref:Uncharacterized protein n=1 Tax=Ensete ventricosum TaxID=4639 RepID=A0A426WVT5_ENSVE|nr:hypothetical protein B296_00054176 [Ensete ventricosum]
MGSHTNLVSRKNTMVIKFCEGASRVEFRSVFRAPARKFKILANPNVLAHVKFQSVFRAPSQKFKILVFPILLAHGKSYKPLS